MRGIIPEDENKHLFADGIFFRLEKQKDYR